MKEQIGAAIGLIVFICAGFWVYTQWDLKRFKELLPTPSVQAETREIAPAQQALTPHVPTETTAPAKTASPMCDTEVETREHIAAEPPEIVPVADGTTADVALDSFLDLFFEETQSDAITSGDFSDVSQEAPYDQALVEKGFEDYNASLAFNPEYAYQRLDDALREQYGDDSDVDIIVETVRRSNEGPITIDDAIHHTEAMIRLVSKICPPEAVAVIADNLEYLRESKQLALEAGEDTVHLFNFRFHVGE